MVIRREILSDVCQWESALQRQILLQLEKVTLQRQMRPQKEQEKRPTQLRLRGGL